VNWPAYTQYKDSGLAHLGPVPSDWSIERMSWLFGEISSGTTPDSKDGEFYGGDINWVTTGELRERAIAETTQQVTPSALASYSALKVYPPDTLLIAMYGATIGRLGWLAQPACTNQACCAFANPLRVETRFAYYSLSAARDHLVFLASGGGQPNINQDKLRSLRIAVPGRDEQATIVEFLDGETAKIDALIGKQEQLIAALQERRSITVDLVLDRHGFTAPRSLADLETATPPRGWRIIHLGTVLRQLTNGFVGPTRDILVDEGVPYVQSTHIKQGRIDFNRRPFYVRREWHDERPRIHLREGDVLIVQTGDIGKVAVVPPDFGEASCHALQIARVKPEILTGNYLGAFLGSWIGYHYLCSLATGALHPHLEAGIRAVPVVVPPLDIQTMIVRQVTEQTAKIDALIAKATEVIDALHEYRSALITDAVTGKIDVRKAVA
jgi:type I restriction enzyme S subunit